MHWKRSINFHLLLLKMFFILLSLAPRDPPVFYHTVPKYNYLGRYLFKNVVFYWIILNIFSRVSLFTVTFIYLIAMCHISFGFVPMLIFISVFFSFYSLSLPELYLHLSKYQLKPIIIRCDFFTFGKIQRISPFTKNVDLISSVLNVNST